MTTTGCAFVIDDADVVVGVVAGLMVADDAVMPSMASDDTTAPSVMICEKVADLILWRPGTFRRWRALARVAIS